MLKLECLNYSFYFSYLDQLGHHDELVGTSESRHLEDPVPVLLHTLVTLDLFYLTCLREEES